MDTVMVVTSTQRQLSAHTPTPTPHPALTLTPVHDDDSSGDTQGTKKGKSEHVCPYTWCGRSFERVNSLKRHIGKCQPRALQVIHKCSNNGCDMEFKQRWRLKRHTKKCTPCRICKTVFKGTARFVVRSRLFSRNVSPIF